MKFVKAGLFTTILVLMLAKIYSTEAQDKPGAIEKTISLDKQKFKAAQALETALSALDNEQWKIRDSKYKIELNPSEDGWLICVTFLPETPGAEAFISVDNDGNVKVVPGF